MARQLKVYGWRGRRLKSKSERNHHGQTREIMAAYSVAEVLRATGMTRGDWNHSGCETGNALELELALANPGRVFWSRYVDHMRGDCEWFDNDNNPVG